MAHQQCTWQRNVRGDVMNACVKDGHCAFGWYDWTVLTEGTRLHFVNACLLLNLLAILLLGRFVQLSEMRNELEGNCQILRPEHVSVHHISMCFSRLELANFQQDINDLPNSMQNYTCVQQRFPFRINQVCFSVALHYVMTLHYTAHVVFRKYYIETQIKFITFTDQCVALDCTLQRNVLDCTLRRNVLDCTLRRSVLDCTTRRSVLDCTVQRNVLDCTLRRNDLEWTLQKCTGLNTTAKCASLYTTAKCAGLYNTAKCAGLYTTAKCAGMYTTEKCAGLYTTAKFAGLYTTVKFAGLYTTAKCAVVYTTVTAKSAQLQYINNNYNNATCVILSNVYCFTQHFKTKFCPHFTL